MAEFERVGETVDNDSQNVPGIVLDRVDPHTPDPKLPDKVDEKLPEPPAPQDEGIEGLRTTVGQLATAVATLTDLVTANLPKDESPNSVPWTHYGSKPRKDED
jgi:hypothetical protein